MKVLFLPDNIEIEIFERITILEASRRAGINLIASCGGNGICGTCKIRILNNVDPPDETEIELLSEKELSENWRLACRRLIQDGMIVEIPLQYRVKLKEKSILKNVDKTILNPKIKKIYFDLSNEKPHYSYSSLIKEKSKEKMLTPEIDFYVFKCIGNFLSTREPKFTGVFCGNKLISIEEGNTSDKLYGIALDLGTTTVVGLLIDLNSGKTKDTIIKINSQISYGTDVIGRLNYLINNESGLEELHIKVINTVNEIINELLIRNSIEKNSVYEICAAGNTVMSHLFVGVSPRGLATAPYMPTFIDPINIRAKEIGIDINPNANIYLFPQIGGFIGGDTVGLVLTSSIDLSEEIVLGVDLGTNGEIVLGSKDRIIACSTAAGPAFECVGIKCGMPATDGAIERIFFQEDEFKLKVIGNNAPKGICGSGLIDITAELLSNGILDSNGKLKGIDELNNNISVYLKSRISKIDNETVFHIYKDLFNEIFITQEDIRKIQFAKAAIQAGTITLKRELHISDNDISKVLLAGAFGNYIGKRSIQTIGLFSEFPEDKIQFIGNSSSFGAKLALMSIDERKRAEKISKIVECINLASRKDFAEKFIESSTFSLTK